MEQFHHNRFKEVRIYAELATRLRAAKRETDFKEIVQAHVLPELSSMYDSTTRSQIDRTRSFNTVLVDIAPCLFHFERNVLLEYLHEQHRHVHDSALTTVVSHLITGSPINDNFSDEDIDITVDYPIALQICELLEQMTGDSFIYSSIHRLVKALIKAAAKETCVIEDRQALAIAKKLVGIIESKLPDNENIQHDGYKIAAFGSVARLRASCSRIFRAEEQWKQVAPSWEELVNDARELPEYFRQGPCPDLAWKAGNIPIKPNIRPRCSGICPGINFAKIPNLINQSNRLFALARAWHRSNDSESAKLFAQEALIVLPGLGMG